MSCVVVLDVMRCVLLCIAVGCCVWLGIWCCDCDVLYVVFCVVRDLVCVMSK